MVRHLRPRVDDRLTLGLVFAAVTLLAAGCSPGTDPGSADATATVLRERALETIERGALYKPSADSEGLMAHDLAPLIIRELSAAGETAAATPIETVSWFQDSVEIFDRSHERWTFFWQTADGSAHGVRMTLDSVGAPALWEIAGDHGASRAVYVSTALEQAAVELHGAPAGGGFASERPGGDGWIVVRAIEPGPMAMGPFVTLSAAEGNISSVICRCMPTQVLDIPFTGTYTLVEADPGESPFPPGGPADGLRLEGLPL